ncbi:MAG: hypothetical protein F4060_10485 [Holophagales bacterium]|nr:hypothetical protein [Holophagales bacterium]MYG30911.1 hypothetical protein [Holophagales bacterium]MYI80350.1 hypothetical protein [Holophagales bacterium]
MSKKRNHRDKRPVAVATDTPGVLEFVDGKNVRGRNTIRGIELTGRVREDRTASVKLTYPVVTDSRGFVGDRNLRHQQDRMSHHRKETP